MPRTSFTQRRPVGLLAAAIAVSMAMPAAGAAAADDGSPTPVPEVAASTVLAANSYPGVQLITTTYRATVSVAVPVLNEDAFADLAARIALQALNGTIGTDQEALTEAIVDGIVKSPNTYFIAGPNTFSRRQSLVGAGTGWVITPDGYLVTAAHVVETPDAQLRQEFANLSLDKLGRQFVRGLQNSGTSFTADQVDRLTNAILGWFAVRMSVDGLKVSVAANLALGFDGLGKDQKAVDAEIVDVGKPYPGNDVALLKIDGQEHLPTISVGGDDEVSPGSTVHVVGFPAASTFSAGLSRDAQVQPTVTEGPVTAVKSTGSGMPVFQTQAPASPGNSGGPVLTDSGSAVGVLVATALNNDGTAAQGQAFVIPASEVQDMLNQNGVTAAESDTTAAYAQAVDAFYAERYKEALPLFEKVETLYPAHPFAAKFITDSKTAIDEGRDRTPAAPEPDEGRGLLWLALGGGVLALLAVGVVGLLLVRRRRSRRSAPAPGYGYPPHSGHPVQPPPGYYGGYPPQGGYPPPQGYLPGNGYAPPDRQPRPPQAGPEWPTTQWSPQTPQTVPTPAQPPGPPSTRPDAEPQTVTSTQATDRPEEQPPAARSDQA
jgi:serine protease Do